MSTAANPFKIAQGGRQKVVKLLPFATTYFCEPGINKNDAEKLIGP